jgi:lysophospholipase L1-like esterase
MPKALGVYRIFCIGGSSVEGYPFRGEAEKSFPGKLQEYFKKELTDTNIEIINAGKGATCSIQLVELVKELVNYEPDCILLYAGHNEYGYYFWQKKLLKLPPIFLKCDLVFSKSYLYRLILKMFNGNAHQNETITWKKYEDPEVVMQKYGNSIPSAEWEHFAQNELFLCEKTFEHNISQINFLLKSRKTKFVICTLVSNIRDFYPFVSFHSSTLASIEQWSEMRSKALNFMEKGQYIQAMESLTALVNLDPSYAETYFNMGITYYNMGNFLEARKNFIIAKDKSPAYAPFQRAPSSLNGTIRTFCKNNEIFMIDIEKFFYLRPENHGIPGNDLFFDNLHPNEEGYKLIAQIIGKSLKENIFVNFNNK